MKKRLRCPKCDQEQLTRIARHGFLRNHVFPILGYYPWECSGCRRESMVRKRGGAYRRISESSSRSADQGQVREASH